MNVPAASVASYRVGVRQRSGTVIFNSVGCAAPPGKTFLTFLPTIPSGGGDAVYEIVAGLDADGSGILSNSQVTCVFEKTPRTNRDGTAYIRTDTTFAFLDKIIVVPPFSYSPALTATQGYGNGVFAIAFPTAANLISAFASGATTLPGASPTVKNVMLDASVIPSADGLSHPLGGVWNYSNQCYTHRLVMPSSSGISGKIAASSAVVNSLVARVIRENEASLSVSAPADWDLESLDINDNDVDFVNQDKNSECHFAIGKARCVGTLEIRYRKESGVSSIISLISHGRFQVSATTLAVPFARIGSTGSHAPTEVARRSTRLRPSSACEFAPPALPSGDRLS